MTNQSLGHPAQARGEFLAMLTREIHIRLVNCGLSGCLFETSVSLPVGTVAGLTLRIGEQEFKDDVRIARCQIIAGAGSVYHVGAEFLWTAAPGPQSMRLAIQQHLHAPAGVRAAL